MPSQHPRLFLALISPARTRDNQPYRAKLSKEVEKFLRCNVVTGGDEPFDSAGDARIRSGHAYLKFLTKRALQETD